MEQTETPTPVEQLKLVGGDPALDFANTAAWDEGVPYSERLTSYERLLAWSRRAELVDESEQAALLEEAERHPDDAARVLKEAVELRDLIHRLFSALANGHEADEADLMRLNAAIGAALGHARLATDDEVGGFVWSWEPDDDLQRPLWPVVRAATELLVSGRLGRVRECAGNRCGWLFVDTSKSGRRRWCSMEDCGNRAKARRHYRRQKSETEHDHP